jgi:hypothetical protein
MRKAAQRGKVMNRARAVVVAIAVIVALAAAVAAALAAPAATTSNAVLDWYQIAGQDINHAAQYRNQPQRARLEMAMVQGAVYDAVNAIAGTNEPYLVAPPAQRW